MLNQKGTKKQNKNGKNIKTVCFDNLYDNCELKYFVMDQQNICERAKAKKKNKFKINGKTKSTKRQSAVSKSNMKQLSQKRQVHDKASSRIEAANEFGSYARFFERLRNIRSSENKEEEKVNNDDVEVMRLNPNRGLFNDVFDDEEEERDQKKSKYTTMYADGTEVSSEGLSKISKEDVEQPRLFPDPDLEKMKLKDKKKRKRDQRSP